MSDISVSLVDISVQSLNINTNKACGPYHTWKGTQRGSWRYMLLLTTLFQNSLYSNVIPEDWHTTDIRSLYKQGNKQHVPI